MAFGQQSGPPASARQVQELLSLLQDAGHTDFRDARGPMGFTQRQAVGKFTRDEAAAFIEQLLNESAEQSEPTATLLSELQGLQSQLSERLMQLDTIILQPGSSERGALITWLEQSDKGETATLCAAPLRINDLLANELLIPLRAAIFTGATLRAHTDFTFMQERLGLWGVKASTVESPFDYEASTLLYLPSDLPLPNNVDYQRAVEQAIVAAAEATGGRTLALFTNMAQLRSTGNAIQCVTSWKKRLLVPSPIQKCGGPE